MVMEINTSFIANIIALDLGEKLNSETNFLGRVISVPNTNRGFTRNLSTCIVLKSHWRVFS